MFATRGAPGTSLETGVGRLDAKEASGLAGNAVIGTLDSGADGPALKALDSGAEADDGGVVAVLCVEVQPARTAAEPTNATTTAAERREPSPLRAPSLPGTSSVSLVVIDPP
jgi:hypothetical protein